MTPFVVGIAGGSGSGKTTLARALVARLGDRCLRIEHDQYYLPLPVGRRPIEHNWDEPAALETARLVRDLDALRAGAQAALPVYEFATHSRAERVIDASPAPVILVEGILSLVDPALRARFDLSVYVDVADDLRLIRRIRRDREERAWSPDLTIEQYLRTVRPMHHQWVEPSRAHALLVLDGTEPTERLLSALLQRMPSDC
jgi:uridine kinase